MSAPRAPRALVLGVRGLVVAGPWSWFVVRGWSPYLDFVAIGLPPLVALSAAGAVGVAVTWRSVTATVAAASLVLFGVSTIVAPMRPATGPRPVAAIRLVSSNTAGIYDSTAVADALLGADADVLVTTELRQVTEDRLTPAYPYHELTIRTASEPRIGRLSVGVFSRWPLSVLDEPEGFPGLRLHVDHPDHPFVLYALHVPKPAIHPRRGYVRTFPQHRALIELIRDTARAERDPVVIVGDLNSPDRSRDYAILDAEFRDAMRASWAGPTSMKATFGWRALFLRIDHIFVSEDWCAADSQRLTVPLSDHKAIAASVGPCP